MRPWLRGMAGLLWDAAAVVLTVVGAVLLCWFAMWLLSRLLETWGI